MPDMTSQEQQRAKDRDQLLDSLTATLHEDPRIESAWLFGSFGRGDADAWSDLDVVIVIGDDRFDEFLKERYEQVSKLGGVVLTFESTINGPPGGCYLMAGYDSPTGIMLVDWYWQPVRAARTTGSKAQLVSRRDIPSYDPPHESLVEAWQRPGNVKPPVLWNPSEEERCANTAALAWAMLAIQTKAIARTPDAKGIGFQEFIENLMATASRSADPRRFGDASEMSDPGERLDRLELIAAELARAPKAAGLADSYGRFLGTVRAHCSSLL
jgi:predicted nucleotidyltransferase